MNLFLFFKNLANFFYKYDFLNFDLDIILDNLVMSPSEQMNN